MSAAHPRLLAHCSARAPSPGGADLMTCQRYLTSSLRPAQAATEARRAGRGAEAAGRLPLHSLLSATRDSAVPRAVSAGPRAVSAGPSAVSAVPRAVSAAPRAVSAAPSAGTENQAHGFCSLGARI